MGSMFNVDGHAILITGGNSGLGRAMAQAFRDAGARVAIGSRRADRNAAVAAELGGDCAAYDLDVRDERSVEQAVAGVADRFGRLDVLINNAGVVNRSSVMALERAAWDQVLTTNLTGAFLCTKHAAPIMARQRSGSIINIASLYALMGPSKGLLSAYTAAKHGVIGLTRANAIELAPLGVRVNAIAPGWHHTELTAGMRDTPAYESVHRNTPMGRWGEPSDIVGAALYLASSAAGFVTGSCLVVDGGFSASDGLDRG
jgi:NAD(P)-dependent dehydrogenase (short-subunit alcohol dehydrogenase family)